MEHIEDFDLFVHPNIEKLKAFKEREEEIFDAVIKYRGPRVAAPNLGLTVHEVRWYLERTVARKSSGSQWDLAIIKHRKENESR